jgi:hypothetical protein
MAGDLGAVYSLADFATTLLPDGKDAQIAKVLHRKNGVLRFSHFELANQMTEHVFAKEMYLPGGAERAIGEGSAPEKPQWESGRESVSYIESHTQVDIIMEKIKGAGFAAWRYKRDLTHSEGLGQTAVDRMFYGTGLPGKIRGLVTRYSTIAMDNVHTAGDANALAVTSLWVIQPGPELFSLLIGADAQPQSPDQYSGGWFGMRDLGLQKTITSTTTNASFMGYETLFDVMFGLCVYDDRAVQRLANIGLDGTDEVDPDQVIYMIEQLPDPEGPKLILANRNGRWQLKKNIATRANVLWNQPDKYGQMAESFYGAQIVLTEGIKNTEAVIT